MNDVQLTAIIIGLTGILRARFPKLDGIVVPIVSLVLGAGLSAAGAPEAWREALVHGIGVALGAVGGMTAVGYAGSKIGEGLANGAKPADSSGANSTTPGASAEPPGNG